MDFSSENMYQTMSIASIGTSTIPKSNNLKPSGRNPLDYSDIQGSQPQDRYGRFHKPDLFQSTDIFGSQSMTLHRETNKPDNTLNVNDIDGAKHRVRDKFLFTKRIVDPLAPTYPLPAYTIPEAPQTKFIRDALDASDIEGTKPKTSKSTRMSSTILSTEDVEGAQASWRPKHARVRSEAEPHDILKVDDISRRTHRHIDHTFRVTNPCDPVYVVNGMEVADDPKYVKPKKNPDFIPQTHLLKTRDIDGAYPGWVPPHVCNPPIEQRREFRNTNFIGDIEGAASDTIKHSIITNRCTHPLMPTYQGLDPGSVLPVHMSPLVPGDVYSAPNVRFLGSKEKKATRGPETMTGQDTLDAFASSGKMDASYKMTGLNFNGTGGSEVDFSRSSSSSTNRKRNDSLGFDNKPPRDPSLSLDLSKGLNGSGRRSNYSSPAASGRKIMQSPADKRAQQERFEAINSVRDLK